MLKTRLITAAVLLLALLALIFFSSPDFIAAALFVVFMGVTAYEWLALLPSKHGRYSEWWSLGLFVSASLTALLIYLTGAPQQWVVLFSAMLWLLLTWRLIQYQRGQTLCCPMIDQLAFLVIPMSAWFAALALHQKSPALLLYVFLLVAVADSAAYFVGRQFGKHKLAERLSPAKTWQGAIGAVVAVSGFALVVGMMQIEQTSMVLKFTVISVLTASLSIVGDLYESYIKRRADVKDSGFLLPGHGGFWDRLDSHLAALSVFTACAYFAGFLN